jgi:hypothetical protein
MRMTDHITIAIVLPLLALAVGCGSGGKTNSIIPSPPAKAVIKVSTVGTPSVTPLVGAQATVHLPTGVSVKTDLNSTQTATNVVVASGKSVPADLVLGVYSAASGTVNVYVLTAAGFPTGEFATINCDIKTGVKPQASDFHVTDLLVSDTNGNPISGLTPSIAVSFH